ncbi:MAG: GNAT family N-acetyltransferase [Alphaproteobacteria bacterium]
MTDTIELAAKMKRLQIWLDQNGAAATVERRHYDGAPFGKAYVTIDPSAQAPVASTNRNRIYLCGHEPGLTRDGLEQLFALFKSHGVERFFVWLLPGPGREEVAAWLRELGFGLNPWTRYVTMLLQEPPQAEPRTDLFIREMSALQPRDSERLSSLMAWPYYASTMGKPGFTHWIAFDAGEPVAIASLACFEHVGYLATANTLESHRRRGAQSAFIVTRIAKARELGMKFIVSETLTMLKSSLGNLERAGLREIYEKQVFGPPYNSA